MHTVRKYSLALGVWALLGGMAFAGSHAQSLPKSPSFKADVQPILEAHCLVCHKPGGMGYEKSGLDMRTHWGFMRGTTHGPIIIPGEASLSNLMRMIEGLTDKAIRMPHNGKKIEKIDRNIIRRWINQGAKNN